MKANGKKGENDGDDDEEKEEILSRRESEKKKINKMKGKRQAIQIFRILEFFFHFFFFNLFRLSFRVSPVHRGRQRERNKNKFCLCSTEKSTKICLSHFLKWLTCHNVEMDSDNRCHHSRIK